MVYMKWTKQAKLPGSEFTSWLHYLHFLPIQKCLKPSPLSTNPACRHPSSSNKYTGHQLQEGTRSYRWELFIIRPSQAFPPPPLTFLASFYTEKGAPGNPPWSSPPGTGAMISPITPCITLCCNLWLKYYYEEKIYFYLTHCSIPSI